jgi:hypothetical protein
LKQEKATKKVEASKARPEEARPVSEQREGASRPNAGWWPKDSKDAYIDRCTKEMASQGLPGSKAASLCRCVADGLEGEFGRTEYMEMMNAQPDPNGSQYDRRLNMVFTACSGYLR